MAHSPYGVAASYLFPNAFAGTLWRLGPAMVPISRSCSMIAPPPSSPWQSAQVSEVVTLDKTALSERVGRLPPRYMRAVTEGLKLVLLG